MTDNKLIAEFLGMELTTDGISQLYYTEDRSLKQIPKFHTDWNWLMKVVDKIEGYNYGATLFIIEDEKCHVNTQNGFEIDSVGHTKIQATYNACVEFVKWYNEQNK